MGVLSPFFAAGSPVLAGTQVLRELLLPGASQTAFAAVGTLTEELREGEPFAQALENYCRRILAEAGVTHA